MNAPVVLKFNSWFNTGFAMAHKYGPEEELWSEPEKFI